MYRSPARIVAGDFSVAVFQPSREVAGKVTEAMRRPWAFHTAPVVATRLGPAA